MRTPRGPGPDDPRRPLPPELGPRRGRTGHPRGGYPAAGPRDSGGHPANGGRGGYPAGGPRDSGGYPANGGRGGYPAGGAGGSRGSRGSRSPGGYGAGGYGPPDGPPSDPYGWVPGGPGGPVPPRRGPRERAVFGVKLVAAALSLLVLAASGYLWWVYRDFNGKVGRVDAIGASTVQDADGKDQNILLVGSDDRSTATPAELKELGTEMDAGKNTDTMILVHVPADGRRATAVSFPRDSYVDIPGVGKGKLNAAYANGAFGEGKADPDRGRRLLVRTISELSGLRIDHYVEVDLLGFYRITKAIGGVEVCLRQPAKDRFSGIDLPAGRQTIQGTQALAFVRQRHGLPNGDLDRIARQQYFLGATFRKMKSAGVIGNPLKLKRLLDAIGTSVRMDADLDPLQLARQVRGLADGNITFKTVPNKGTANVDGRSVILLDEPALPGFFRSLSSAPAKSATATRTVPRGQVSVQVYNGTGRAGLAGSTATALRTAGFVVAGTANADRRDYARTEIRYAPGKDAEARTLAAAIPGTQLAEKDGLGESVQLVLGSDFSGLKTAGSGSGSGGGSNGGGSSSPATSANAPGRTAADAGCIN